jgi:hypothetical protein
MRKVDIYIRNRQHEMYIKVTSDILDITTY